VNAAQRRVGHGKADSVSGHGSGRGQYAVWTASDKSKRHSLGKGALTAGSAILILILAISTAFVGNGPNIGDFLERQYLSREAKLAILSDHIQQTLDGQSILVIAEETEVIEPRCDFNKLNAEFAERIGASAFYEFPKLTFASEEEAMMAEEDFRTANQYNEILKTYPQVDVVVVLNHLPMDYQMLDIWDVKRWNRKYHRLPPKLILAEHPIYDMRRPIKAGMIVAATPDSPTAIYDYKKPLPKDIQERFDQQYLLVTPDNVDSMTKEYPGLFMEE